MANGESPADGRPRYAIPVRGCGKGRLEADRGGEGGGKSCVRLVVMATTRDVNNPLRLAGSIAVPGVSLQIVRSGLYSFVIRG